MQQKIYLLKIIVLSLNSLNFIKLSVKRVGKIKIKLTSSRVLFKNHKICFSILILSMFKINTTDLGYKSILDERFELLVWSLKVDLRNERLMIGSSATR